MKYLFSFLVSISVFGYCDTAHALIISEVAWRGSDITNSETKKCDWIELYNDENTTISLDSLTLAINDSSYQLSGSIASGEYYLIESSHGDCPYNHDAKFDASFGFQISDKGATTTVSNASNSHFYNDPWPPAGENETAQWSNGTWISAPATPGYGYENSSETSPTAQDTPSTATSESSSGSGTSKKVRMTSIDIDIPATLFVGVPIQFEVHATPDGSRAYHSHMWSFGDFTTSEWSVPTHTYQYPGTYIVYVTVENGTEELTARKQIRVIEPKFELARTLRGDITLTNKTAYEIDLEDFSILSEKIFTMPEHTILLPHTSITIPRIYIEPSNITLSPRLLDPSGHMLAGLEEIQTILPKAETAPPQPIPKTHTASILDTPKKNSNNTITQETATSTPTSTEQTITSTEVTHNDEPKQSRSLYPYALLSLLVLGGAGASFVRTRKQ